MRLGVHMTLKGGFASNVKRLAEFGVETVQFFPGNPTGWALPDTSPQEIEKRAGLLKQAGIWPLVIHAAYLVNLASQHEDFYEKSRHLLAGTLRRASLYGADFVVVHAGSHGGKGADEGIRKMVSALQEVLRDCPQGVVLLLENTSGGGSFLGGRFEELGEIMDQLPGTPLGICLDTAHAWAAGYDLASPEGVERALEEFQRHIGLHHLKAIHANDTNMSRGSGRDRHMHIGKGAIGLSGFQALLGRDWPAQLPVILENPEAGSEKDRENFVALKSCAGTGKKEG